jgi:hypothetical protein
MGHVHRLCSSRYEFHNCPPQLALYQTGYCGETSIQSAGLFFGNWLSEEQVRYAAGNAEVLIDVNAHTAAANLAFTFNRWDINNQPQPQANGFFQWIKACAQSRHDSFPL